MERAYQLVRDADFIALFFLACLVFCIGIAFSDRHPRIWNAAAWFGAIALLAYVATAIVLEGYEPLESVAAYVLRGGLAAAIVIGCSRSIGAFCAWTWHIIAPIPSYFAARNAAARRRAEAERRRQEEGEERRRRDEQFHRDRERANRLAEQQQKVKTEMACRQATEQERRMEARSGCELCYAMYLNEVADRFPKSVFDAFMEKYMNDVQPAEAVERRSKELRGIIQQHRDAAKPPKKFHSIQELTAWFLNEKTHVESLPIDSDVRDGHLANLNIRYAELTQHMLETMEP